MGKNSNTKIIGIGVIVIIVSVALGGYLGIIPTEFSTNPSTASSLTPLSISDAVPIDCDIRNKIEIQDKDGTRRIVGQGVDGFIPNSLVDTKTRAEIDEIHIQLTLECSGSIMRQGSATVSGTNFASLCSYFSSSQKECLGSTDGSTYTNKLPLISKVWTYHDGEQAFSIPSQSISNRQEVVIQQMTLTTDDVLRLYGDPPPSKSLNSVMHPIINFILANGQRVSVNQHAQEDRTTSSWSGWTNVEPPVDTDNDGIPDDGDLCPTEPSNEPDGCPIRDSDGDGIIDSEDECANTPNNESVFTTAPKKGCSSSQIDADGDGIFDNIDVCPTMQENFNGFEDADGCPDTLPTPIDSDGDGILDELDNCPNTHISADIDSFGCPIDQVCPDDPSITPVDVNGDGFIDNCSQDDDFGFGDSDDDGVIDRDDICPDTITGVSVDSDGCQILHGDPPPCPQGVQPNPDGTCPDDIFDGLTDSDGDGVNDAEDICPNTLPNTSVDSTGCVLPIIGDLLGDDFDGDGVIDRDDDCPVQKGDVENFGCPTGSVIDSIIDIFDGDDDVTTVTIIDCIQGFTPNPDGSLTCVRIPTSPTSTPTQIQSDDNIIEGFSDFTVLVVVGIIAVFVIGGIAVGTGKAKL